MQRIKSIVWGSRRRRIASVVVAFALTVTSTAVAAFIIYSGVGGSGSGSFTSTTSTVNAFTVSSTANPVLVPGGASAPFAITIKNEDTGAAHNLNSLDASVSSNIAGCGAYVQLNGEWSAVGNLNTTPLVVAAGATNTTFLDGATVLATSAAPVSCAGATWTINFTGTSS